MAPALFLVTPLVSVAVNKVYSLLEEEFLKFYNAKEDVEKLRDTLMTIRSVLVDAEDRQVDSEELRDWLGKLKEAAYDANDLLDSWTTQVKKWGVKSKVRKILINPFTRMSFRHDVGDDIKKLRSRLDEIARDRLCFHLRENMRYDIGMSRDRPAQTSPFVPDDDVVGRKAESESLVKLLVESDEPSTGNITFIGIIGMPGMGKTTLAQMVYNDGRVVNHFEIRMWVCVSDRFDLDEIRKQMRECQSGVKQDEVSKYLIDRNLSEVLKDKKYLLVLDDVWTDDYMDWDPLLRTLTLGGLGSKVLITSRNGNVWEKVGTKGIDPYSLSRLAEQECWSLFKRIALKDARVENQDLERCGKEIVNRCDGLPLLVKQMGGLLCGNLNVNEWERIRTSEIWELRGPILPALRLSYNYLPWELKQCFAYCATFPKSYEYNKDELIKLWMGELFIEPSPSNNEKLEDTGIRYFNQLLARFFFQQTSENRYRMHDLIHDLARCVSRPYCFQVKDNDSCYIIESSHHVSLLCKDVEKPVLNMTHKSKKLRTFLMPVPGLKDFGKSLDKMFKTFKYMRVLDLSSSTIPVLPKSIKRLKLLCYLDLSNTEIKEIPNSICKLYNLQTLKLLGCPWIFSLPKDLGNLVNLRHLELDEIFWYKAPTLPPQMGNISGLHNLHSFRVGRRKGYGIEEVKNLVYLSGTLRLLNLENAVNSREASLKDKKCLEKVVLEWSDRDGNPQEQVADEKALTELQLHPNVKEFQISHYRGTTLPLWLRTNLLPNLVTVSFKHCKKCKKIFLGQLPNLKKLYLKGMLELEEWEEEMEYKSLKELRISNCPKLWKMPRCFLNLFVMKIKKAGSLKALPPTASLRFLTLIDNPVLEEWTELLLKLSSTNVQGQPEILHQHSFIHLLELKIIGCPRLQLLPQVFYPQKLEISRCELLNGLPAPNNLQRLQHLRLDSGHDGSLVSSIRASGSMQTLVISNISTIVTLPKWPTLSRLRALYIRDCNDLVFLSEQNNKSWCELTSLDMLSIRGCPKLVTLPNRGLPTSLKCLSIRSCPSFESFGPPDILKSLTSLNDLYLEDCPALWSMPEGGLSSSVSHLQIKGCPLLIEQCRSKDGDGPFWPMIRDIPDKDIDMAPSIAASPSCSSSTSATWYQQVRSRRVTTINIREVEQPQRQQSSSNDSMRRDKGPDWKGKGKMVADGPSTSA